MRSHVVPALASLFISASAVAADRSFPVATFDRVILSGIATVQVTHAGQRSVVASGEAADLDRLDIRVENGALVIGQKPGSSRMSRRSVTVAVATPELAAATISGSGELSVDQVRGPFAARISGAGDMLLSDLDVPTLSMAISGSGTLKAAGQCGSGNIRVSGSGNVESGGLRCATMETVVTGSGNVTAAATDIANVRITGSGNVRITGGARCSSSTTGSGTVRCS